MSWDLESSATWLQVRWLTEENRFLMPKITTLIEKLGPVASELAITLINLPHNKCILINAPFYSSVMGRSRITLATYCAVFLLILKGELALSKCNLRDNARIGQYLFVSVYCVCLQALLSLA